MKRYAIDWFAGTLEEDKNGYVVRAEVAQALYDALKAALSDPHVKKRLEYLHKGIGVNTEEAVWLDVEKALDLADGESE